LATVIGVPDLKDETDKGLIKEYFSAYSSKPYNQSADLRKL